MMCCGGAIRYADNGEIVKIKGRGIICADCKKKQ